MPAHYSYSPTLHYIASAEHQRHLKQQQKLGSQLTTTVWQPQLLLPAEAAQEHQTTLVLNTCRSACQSSVQQQQPLMSFCELREDKNNKHPYIVVVLAQLARANRGLSTLSWQADLQLSAAKLINACSQPEALQQTLPEQSKHSLC